MLSEIAFALKGLVALAGVALLGRVPKSDASAADWRSFDRTLAALGILAALAWTNLGLFHRPDFIKYEDVAHNYLGAKYYRELGYTELYRCVSVAATEIGHSPASDTRWIRDLYTGQLVPAAQFMSTAEPCTQFSPERWSEFLEDVRRLVTDRPPIERGSFYLDFGFNASPLWIATASAAIALAPDARAGLVALASIDCLLLAVQRE
jgi:hypothetical protein